jgi:hypothetical protein
MANQLAISRKLVAAGMEQKPAEAVAEVVDEHHIEDAATKGDILRLEKKVDSSAAEIKALRNSNKFNQALLIGLIVAVVASSLNS